MKNYATQKNTQTPCFVVKKEGTSHSVYRVLANDCTTRKPIVIDSKPIESFHFIGLAYRKCDELENVLKKLNKYGFSDAEQAHSAFDGLRTIPLEREQSA